MLLANVCIGTLFYANGKVHFVEKYDKEVLLIERFIFISIRVLVVHAKYRRSFGAMGEK